MTYLDVDETLLYNEISESAHPVIKIK